MRPGSSLVKAGPLLFVLAVLAYGALAGVVPSALGGGVWQRILTSVANVVALMHFWYDGFVWSVQRKEFHTDAGVAQPTG